MTLSSAHWNFSSCCRVSSVAVVHVLMDGRDVLVLVMLS